VDSGPAHVRPTGEQVSGIDTEKNTRIRPGLALPKGDPECSGQWPL
jgi:hypothetical protein